MPRAAARIRLADVQRVIRAAKREGVGCEIDLRTGLARVGGPPAPAPALTPAPASSPPALELDAELAAWAQKHGYG